jgi:hypothetical protein
VTVASVLDPHVLHEDRDVVVWAAVTRVGDALVADVRAQPASPAGVRLFEPRGATLLDQGRPRLSWALLTDLGERPLPPSGSGGGSERHVTWTWTGSCAGPARAVRLRVELPLSGTVFDAVLPLG